MSTFDPNGVGISNGNIFGFPVTEDNAHFVIIPIPWDVTTSYGKGTSAGPEAILEASVQLDFYHPKLAKAFDTQVFMSPISEEWKDINEQLCLRSADYIDFLEQGGQLEDSVYHQESVTLINEAQRALQSNLKAKAGLLFKAKKTPVVLGGDHSTPLGLMEAVNALGKPFGILQIDAHADLREAYEGFEQSHASIMYNALELCDNLEQLVQVGIRDICQDEVDLISSNPRVSTFYDWQLKADLYKGRTWDNCCEEIISKLPELVYISFDIDGLKPYLCPNTGTPVPGGFELEDVVYLLFKLVESGKKIIAFDLNEVSPSSADDWDANVGARALWQLICAAELSRRSFTTE